LCFFLIFCLGKKKAAIQTAFVEEDPALLTPHPSTPQKQRTQPQDPTLSASKSLARLNLFADNEKTDLKTAGLPLKTAMTPTSLFTINPAVRKAYKIVQKATGALGGNGATGAIYGELTMHSMQKVINFMIENCDLSSASRFIDVGSGLGKPNVHAAQDPCCRISIGIELEEIRWQLGMQNLKYLTEEMSEEAHLSVHADTDDRDVKLVTGVNFIHGDIFDVATTVSCPTLRQPLTLSYRTPSPTSTCTTWASLLLSNRRSPSTSTKVRMPDTSSPTDLHEESFTSMGTRSRRSAKLTQA
jgi:hypothetical protein